ncbi:kinesin-2b-like [Zophobas morio]|uniref:kinesin-2b-like n=1 Tax=Zophobas morio TaxID=2755281 RepID=UPI003082EABC
MTHLKVGVRVRPLSTREIERGSCGVLEVEDDGRTVAVTNIKVPEQHAGDSRKRTRRFTFDFCFHQNSTQDDVFRAVESVVGEAIKKRRHSCVLAYGQSASGKTHTMMGFPHDPGLIPKLCERIFGYLLEAAVGEEVDKAKVDVSYLEIYNEKVRDLLHENDKCALKVRQHPKKGPYVQGLTSHPAYDSASLFGLLAAGNNTRRVGATLTNPQSSRSHSVFIVEFDGIKLTLVDLAGSERASNRCCTTSRFREGANINKSLVALGNVISALAEDTKCSKGIRRRFIPFRDSVLTWLLKDTLGGNSDTVMIATISPSSECYSETVNTLRFGQRAKLIVSIPVVNEDPKERTIRELRAEIARLRELLKSGQIPMSNDPLNTTEKLIPVMSFTDNNKPPQGRLRRTYSVDHSGKKMEVPSRKFGSEEVLRKKSTKTEKSQTDLKPKVEAKVDSIRRTPVKPRSQIVAAVTHRLYAKTKKKEASTDTHDLPIASTPKELSICSNARLQLKELTKRALKAQKVKNEETQTEHFPVLRVKEMATDVDDLKSLLYEVKDVETSTVALTTEDKEISCTFLDSLQNAFVVTRSCGTQSQSTVSFTKYLQEPPKVEVFNPHTANPIYTSSVNINISHNYINKQRIFDSVSEDSLDDQSNVCFPTPDLISNHNSLEPHSHPSTSKESIESKVRHATCHSIDDHQEEIVDFVEIKPPTLVAKSSTSPHCQERISSINIPSVHAPEVYHQGETPQRCQHFTPAAPEVAKPIVIDCKTYSDDCITLVEPMVLKSIMKHIPEATIEPDDLPDSLEYHKKVHFNKTSCQNERMMKAMSGFLEEATILMSNLTLAAARLDQDQEYDVQVTVSGLEQRKKKRKTLRVLKNAKCQTDDMSTKTSCVQTDAPLDLTNKYDLLLEDSCRRLEDKIAAASDDSLYNPWDLLHEDTSLESNPRTSSDYGSLPRRRKRHSSCTPSAYLRQLATMRRQVVEASREELSNNSDT